MLQDIATLAASVATLTESVAALAEAQRVNNALVATLTKSVAALAEAQSVNAATEADHLDADITEAINAQILTKVMDMNNIDDITTGPNAVANAGAIPALKEATSTQGFHYATSGETCVAVPQNECAAAGNAMRDWTKASIDVVEDWNWVPCGCFIWENSRINFNTHACDSVSLNGRGRRDAQGICKVKTFILSLLTSYPCAAVSLFITCSLLFSGCRRRDERCRRHR